MTRGGACPPHARAMAVSVRTPGHSVAGETGISPAPGMADAALRDPQHARPPPWMVGTPSAVRHTPHEAARASRCRAQRGVCVHMPARGPGDHHADASMLPTPIRDQNASEYVYHVS